MTEVVRSRSTRALPSAAAATWLIAALSVRRARRGRLLQIVAVLLLLPVPAGLFALLGGRGGQAFFDVILTAMLRYLLPLAMSLFSATMVAEEVQGRTITYLYSRPIARWTLPLGKYLGTVAVTLVLFAVALTATYLVCMGTELIDGLDRLAIGLLVGALALVHFGAVATAFGAMVTSYPFVAMMIYVLLVEVGFGFVPGVFKAFSMGVNLTAMVGLYRPHTDSYFMPDPTLTPAISTLIVVSVTAVWLLIALGWVGSHEYRTDR